MEITIALTHVGSNSYVTVDLSIAKSMEVKMKSRLGEVSERLKMPDGSEVPLTAAEAACFSGAFFALRKMGNSGYAVTMDKAFGELPLGNLTICAEATSIGVLYAVDHLESIAEEVLDGWRLAELSKRGDL